MLFTGNYRDKGNFTGIRENLFVIQKIYRKLIFFFYETIQLYQFQTVVFNHTADAIYKSIIVVNTA